MHSGSFAHQLFHIDFVTTKFSAMPLISKPETAGEKEFSRK